MIVILAIISIAIAFTMMSRSSLEDLRSAADVSDEYEELRVAILQAEAAFYEAIAYPSQENKDRLGRLIDQALSQADYVASISPEDASVIHASFDPYEAAVYLLRESAIQGSDLREVHALVPDGFVDGFVLEAGDRAREAQVLARDEEDDFSRLQTLQLIVTALVNGVGLVLVVFLAIGVRRAGRREVEMRVLADTHAALGAAKQEVEAALMASERDRERFEAIAASIATGILIADGEGRVEFANAELETLIGIDAVELLGQHASDLRLLLRSRASSSEEADAALAQVFAESGPAPHPYRIAFAWPVPRVLEVTPFRLRAPKGRGGRGYTFRDITRAAELDQMKSEFIGIASHELRTPLTGIFGFSELLVGSPNLPAHERSWAEHVHTEGRRLVGIVNELLDVSRIEAGGVAANLQPTSVAEALQRVIAAVGAAATAQAIELEADGNAVDVFADPGMLEHVLTNLVENAVKYSPRGTRVRLVSDVSQDEVAISVADEGIGIAAEDLAGIFRPFSRAVTAENAHIRGTGLGLYLVREFVTRMDGTIDVESTPGVGSTFTIRLRRARPQQRAA